MISLKLTGSIEQYFQHEVVCVFSVFAFAEVFYRRAYTHGDR